MHAEATGTGPGPPHAAQRPIARSAADDPFAAFDEASSASQDGAASDRGSQASSETAAQAAASGAKKPWFALLWNLTETGASVDLEKRRPCGC
ncbi:hypothetical protein [Sorangium sp. So ce426]